jgi:naphthoate synthase
VGGFELTDIAYHRATDHGAVRVAFDRPEVRNAFRPHTVDELYRVLDHARMSSDVGCVPLTGNGPPPRDGYATRSAAGCGSTPTAPGTLTPRYG